MRKAPLLLVSLLLAISLGCSGEKTAVKPPYPPVKIDGQAGVQSQDETAGKRPTQTLTSTAIPLQTQAITSTISPPIPTPSAPHDAVAWEVMPVIPQQVSQEVHEIYQRGLSLGNDPGAFSKIGDCGSTPAWFLGDFDHNPKYYSLGDHQELTAVIDAFQGSFDRDSLAAKSGFNASSILTPLWANREHCRADETPLACEYRIHQPSFAFIMLGTNDIWHQDSFEPQMRKIIQYSINHGVVLILSTKADNGEGDGSINAIIARLAQEYRLPLWNYWLAVQPLPNQGLQEDGAHISWGPNRFDDPSVMKKGWPIRNLTALQTLEAVWRGVTQ
jgi:hypothetical protein